MSRIKRGVSFFQSQRGQTIIEFAFIMPIVCLFLFVIVDFGIALDRRLVLQHAVREGARYAAVNGDAPLGPIKQRVIDESQGVINNASDIRITYTDINGNGSPFDAGDSVDVQLCYTYEPNIIRPIFSGLFGGSVPSIKMNVTGSSRLEQAARSYSGDPPCPP